MVDRRELDIEGAQFCIPDSYKEKCTIYEKELQRGKESGYLDVEM